MNQAIEYIRGRVTSSEFKTSGEITTESIVIFDNGTSVTGTSVREIMNFDKDEASNAAFENAISGLSAGVNFILTKV